jgi:hypothetical protein
MIETSGRILKKDDVELDGQFQLDLGLVKYEAPEPAKLEAPVAEPQARIIENQPGYVVIEVTCSCGTKVCLKCDYSNDEMPESS